MLTLENCSFAFRCPKEWDALERDLFDAEIRFCHHCRQQVFRCQSDAALNTHTAAGHCIAIQRPDELSAIMVGLAETPYLVQPGADLARANKKR